MWTRTVLIISLAAISVADDQLKMVWNQVGDVCTIAGRNGVWTDLGECRGAKSFVQVAAALETTLKAYDVLVCCEMRHIRNECRTGHNRFEFTRHEFSRNGATPLVTMKEICTRFGDATPESTDTEAVVDNFHLGPRLSGTTCQIDGQNGVWTRSWMDCVKLYRLPEVTMANMMADGCCVLQRISDRKCQEYRKLASATCTTDELWHSLAELYGVDNMSLPYCVGVLISENFVITSASCVRDYDVRYVRIGPPSAQSDLLRVKSPRENVTYEAPIKNAFGLLQLTEPFHFSHTMRPACLSQPYPERASGGGAAANHVLGTPMFQSNPLSVNLSVVALGICQRAWRSQALTDAVHLCGRKSENLPWLKTGSAGISHTHDPTLCQTAIVNSILISNFDPWLIFTRIAISLDWLEATVWGT